MKNKLDFDFLKHTLIFLVVAIILSLAFIFGGLQFEQAKYEEYTTTRSSLEQTHLKYKKLVDDLDLLQLYRESYKGYKENGLIGAERRLTWIETLEAVNDDLKLPKLTYALSPQEGFKRPKFIHDKKILVNSTPMLMNIDLLHEEDLFKVFNGIQERIDNLFTIEQCTLSRKQSSGALLNTRSANLNSNCLMRWITVDVQS